MVLNRKAAFFAALAALAAASPVERGSGALKVPIVKKASKINAKDLLTSERARIASFATAASSGTAPAVNELYSYIAATSESACLLGPER